MPLVCATACELHVSKTLAVPPFEVCPPGVVSRTFGFKSDSTAPAVQTYELTETNGVIINVDLQNGESSQPDYQCRLRVVSNKKDVFAKLLHDAVLNEAEMRQDAEGLTIAEIKHRLEERSGSKAMQGCTRKSDLIDALMAHERTLRMESAGQGRIRAGSMGLVIKPLHKNKDGEHRIGLRFFHYGIIAPDYISLAPSQVEVTEPLPSTGDHPVGSESSLQIVGSSIAVTRGNCPVGGKTEYFVSGKGKAFPGVLVPWHKAFMPKRTGGPVFSTSRGVPCQLKVEAKLQIVFKLCEDAEADDTGADDDSHDTPETPAPRVKRPRSVQ